MAESCTSRRQTYNQEKWYLSNPAVDVQHNLEVNKHSVLRRLLFFEERSVQTRRVGFFAAHQAELREVFREDRCFFRRGLVERVEDAVFI